jgi:hypothetical protein
LVDSKCFQIKFVTNKFFFTGRFFLKFKQLSSSNKRSIEMYFPSFAVT